MRFLLLTAADFHSRHSFDYAVASSHIVERFDCYRGTPVDTKVSKKVNVHGVNFQARKAS